MKDSREVHSRQIWKNSDYVSKYIEDFRGAVPFAVDQIEIMLDAIAANTNSVKSFADLGCGNGILAGAILLRYPDALGTVVDFYEPVLEEAKQQLMDYVSNLNFVASDLSDHKWIQSIKKNVPFDVIVSGYTTHHLSNKRKKELYAEVFKMLKPGGIFINIDRVLPEGPVVAKMENRILVENIREFNKKKGVIKTTREIVKEYAEFISSKADIPLPAGIQLKWLAETGFEQVTVFFRAYIGLVFGGVKPKQIKH